VYCQQLSPKQRRLPNSRQKNKGSSLERVLESTGTRIESCHSVVVVRRTYKAPRSAAVCRKLPIPVLGSQHIMFKIIWDMCCSHRGDRNFHSEGNLAAVTTVAATARSCSLDCFPATSNGPSANKEGTPFAVICASRPYSDPAAPAPAPPPAPAAGTSGTRVLSNSSDAF